jgi:hypothetical protein
MSVTIYNHAWADSYGNFQGQWLDQWYLDTRGTWTHQTIPPGQSITLSGYTAQAQSALVAALSQGPAAIPTTAPTALSQKAHVHMVIA